MGLMFLAYRVVVRPEWDHRCPGTQAGDRTHEESFRRVARSFYLSRKIRNLDFYVNSSNFHKPVRTEQVCLRAVQAHTPQ